ncbi:MAG TPA: hypothetical protein VK638_21165, partial [Edaphobacter sp.]|nr:hypothetical protein [Edaphobacter sp.]
WRSYYLIAFLIKTPLGSLILMTVSLLLYRIGRSLERREMIFLFIPVLVVLLVTMQAKVNIGLRHILPIYPFLFVLASRLATVQPRRGWPTHVLIVLPLVLTIVSSLKVAPHQLAYFNEMIGGPDQGYRYLVDSNLDWGQDLKGVKEYMDRERLPIIYFSYFGSAPASYYGIRYQYVPWTWPVEWPPLADKVPTASTRKIFAISANHLQDVVLPHNPLFQWLRQRTPVAKIGYSIFLYDLSDDREGLARLDETYVKAGLVP